GTAPAGAPSPRPAGDRESSNGSPRSAALRWPARARSRAPRPGTAAASGPRPAASSSRRTRLPADPEVTPPALDGFGQRGHDLLHGEARGVDLDGIRRLAQGGQITTRVLGVARGDLAPGRPGFQPDPPRAQIALPPPCALLQRGVQVELHL